LCAPCGTHFAQSLHRQDGHSSLAAMTRAAKPCDISTRIRAPKAKQIAVAYRSHKHFFRRAVLIDRRAGFFQPTAK
jgi:hypothetical protein